MDSSTLTRRDFMRIAGGASVAAVAAACAPAPVQQPPAEVGEKEAPVAVKQPVDLKVAVWTIADRMWMEDAAAEFGEMRDDVNVSIDKVPYGDALKKTMAGMATGTQQDVFFAAIRWGKYLAYKGAFLWLDELVEAKDPDIDDFYEWALDGASFEGKLFGLPHEMNPGAYACCYYNKNLLADAGVDEPTDDWTVEDFPEMAAKIQDRDNQIFGTDWLLNRFYAFSSVARTFGGRLITQDGTQWTMNSDPKTVEAARWVYDIRNKWDAANNREEKEGLAFTAGRVGLHITNVQSSGRILTGAGDKFDVDIVLAPQSPSGLHGFYTFCAMMCAYSGTKLPQEAYDCIAHITSKDVAMRAFLEQTQPSGRKSVWQSAQEKAPHPIWKRVGDWMANEEAPGDMPFPANLRFEEIVDKWSNVHHKLWYGDLPFQEGLDLVQSECEQIVNMPRD